MVIEYIIIRYSQFKIMNLPGRSGVLSPFSDMKSLYFNEEEEPNHFAYELQKDIKRILNKQGKGYIEIECDNPKDYYDLLMKMQDFIDKNIYCYGTSKEDQYSVIVEEELNVDDPEESKKKKDKKKKTEE